MRVLVVEDEPGRVDSLRHLLTSMDESITVIGAVPEVLEKEKWPSGNKPDLILVNKKAMKADKSVLLSRANLQTTVIFTSDAGEYSFQAFRAKTLEHLLKLPPIPTYGIRSRFLVKQGQKMISVSTEKIAFFFSEERFIFFKTFDRQKYLIEYRMDQLERMLPPIHFYRVNRSFIVSVNAIDHIQLYPGSRLRIYLKPSSDKEIIVSREKVAAFKSWLGE